MRIKGIISLLFFCVLNVSAQDPYFMNVNQSLLALNPSYAGSNGGFRNQISHTLADNGSGIRNNRKAVDFKIHSLNAGLGFVINSYREGFALTNLELGFIYAQYFPIYGGTHTVVPSVKISHVTRTVNDPAFGPFSGRSEQTGDISAGFLFNYSKEFNFGLYWFHMNQPGNENTLGKVESRYLFHMSYTIQLTKKDMVQIFYRSDIQGTTIKSQVLAHFLLARNLIVNVGLDAKGRGCGGVGFKAGVFSALVGYDASLPDYGYIGASNGLQNGNWEIHGALLISNKTTRGTMQPFDKL